MSGYNDGEALIETRIDACQGYSGANVSRSDWRVLNHGASSFYAILRPGPFEIVWQTLGSYSVRWTTVIEVWQRYTDETTSYTNLYGNIAPLFAMLAYPHLAGSLEDSTITGGEEPQEMWNTGGGPAWIKWEMRVSWIETIPVTFSE